MLKSHGCGSLGLSSAGTSVRLAGWVHAHRDHGGVLFVDLRDETGLVQVVFEAGELFETASRFRDEWCIAVEGLVRPRPAGTENPKLPTGQIEVEARSVEVLNAAKPLPFQMDGQADEVTRLRYRYLDLRREPMQLALRTRAAATRAMRNWLDTHGFIEVETPILGRTTPEGARDFLVPSRLQPGSFYALPQSPQILKQTLMASGVERYYQFARCLRDEDLRADRQPEHTQLDMEMAFVSGPEDVYEVMEGVLQAAFKACLDVEVAVPFQRMPYREAMDRFGSDKPDLRVPGELVDLSPVFAGTEFKAFAGVLDSGGSIRGLRVPGRGSASRKELDGLIERAKELGAQGLVWMVVEEAELRAPIAKFLSSTELKGIRESLDAEVGDLVLLVAGERTMACSVLGSLRTELIEPAESGFRFLWVTDFPLLEQDADSGAWTYGHNPFTMPSPGWEELIDTDPAACGSWQYDLVINGWEMASGSVRIHRPDVQLRILEKIGVSEATARDQFGYLLEAFDYGAPPHGGFGMGVDRIVALMLGLSSIREVIAFPKTQSGADPMTGAPSPADARQLRDLKLRLVEET